MTRWKRLNKVRRAQFRLIAEEARFKKYGDNFGKLQEATIECDQVELEFMDWDNNRDK